MRSLILDANVLVLLIVGNVDRKAITFHKRTRQFIETDFDLLVEIVQRFDLCVVTTSVLTEASNLLAHTHEALKLRLLVELRRFVAIASEERPESRVAVADEVYTRLGLTDAGLMTCVRSGSSLLTTDLGLYLAAAKLSDKVFNFNHLRQNDLLS